MHIKIEKNIFGMKIFYTKATKITLVCYSVHIGLYNKVTRTFKFTNQFYFLALDRVANKNDYIEN